MAATQGATRPIRLLIVEDMATDARLIQFLLDEAGRPIASDHVSSMQAAVHALADASYDLALLDLGLPDGFGLENIQRLKGLAPELAIIVMTGLDDEQTARSAQERGAQGYLVKGSVTDGHELLTHIEAALASSVGELEAGPGDSNLRLGIECNGEGVITGWGEDVEQVMGFSADRMLGQPMDCLIPAARRDEIALIDGRIRRGQSVREFETQRLHADGRERDVSLSVFPLSGANAGPAGSRTMIRDITELKRDRADAMQLAAIVESSQDVIIAITLDGIITHWNPGAQNILGYSAENTKGQPFTMLIPGERHRRAREMLEQARRGQPVTRFDGRMQRNDGSEVDVSISLTPVRDRDGGLVGAAIVASDITERKQAELALEREVAERTTANRELQATLDQLRDAQDQLVQAEKMASLGGLVAGVAHEINTPVGVGVTAASHLRIKLEDLQRAYAEGQLKRSQLDHFIENADQATHIVLSNLRRASELIQSFKQVAVDQSSSERRRFRLREYIDEILLSLKPRIKRSNVTVEVDCDPALELNSVPGAYSQIFTNLVLNSLLHGYEAQQTGCIRLRADIQGQTLVVDYRDDGQGMDAETLSRIFDPFFTTKRGSGGSGLGMHVVYNLITQKLRGKVRVESRPGQGMHLQMRLPIDLEQETTHG